MQYTSNYNLKKPEGTDVVNIDDLNENADIIDQKLKELEDGVYNIPPNSVNDEAIGSRTPDQSQVPESPGTGTLTQLISWLANRIKVITGKTNWWDAPPTTLQAAKTHMDAAAPHSGHETLAGAQAKADAALNSAKQYTDQEVAEVNQALTEHLAKTASINAIGHVYAAEFTATLSTTSWSGSAAPYTQTVTINGITSAHNPIIDVVMSGTYSTDQQRTEQWGYIYKAVTGTNQITFYASEKPTIDLPIRVKVVM